MGTSDVCASVARVVLFPIVLIWDTSFSAASCIFRLFCTSKSRATNPCPPPCPDSSIRNRSDEPEGVSEPCVTESKQHLFASSVTVNIGNSEFENITIKDHGDDNTDSSFVNIPEEESQNVVETETSEPVFTHIVAFHVYDADILQRVQDTQEQIMSSKFMDRDEGASEFKYGEIFRETLVPTSQLHFTLHAMVLGDDQQLNVAKEVVDQVWAEYKHDLELNPVLAKIEGIGHFNENILFAKMQGENDISRLTELANSLREKFELLGISGETHPFVPHMTIANMSKAQNDHLLEMMTFPREIWREFKFFDFGVQRMHGIRLVSLNELNLDNSFKLIANYPLG